MAHGHFKVIRIYTSWVATARAAGAAEPFSSVYSNTSASRPARARAHPPPPPPPPGLPLYYYYLGLGASRSRFPALRPSNVILYHATTAPPPPPPNWRRLDDGLPEDRVRDGRTTDAIPIYDIKTYTHTNRCNIPGIYMSRYQWYYRCTWCLIKSAVEKSKKSWTVFFREQ